DVDAVDSDRAFLDIVKPQQQRDERGLAGAGVADDGYGFAGLDGEGYVAEDPVWGLLAGRRIAHGQRRACRALLGWTAEGGRPHMDLLSLMVLVGIGVAIGEPDVIKFNSAGALGTLGLSGRNYLHGRVQQLEDAFAGGHG